MIESVMSVGMEGQMDRYADGWIDSQCQMDRQTDGKSSWQSC